MAAALVGLLLVAYVPGAAIFRIPFANRPLRAGLPAEERTFWAIVLSTGLTTGVVLALAGAAAYTFPRLLAVNGSLAGLIAVIWRGRLAYRGEAPRPSLQALVPVAVVALGMVLFFPPSEYIMGGKDPGVYMNEGVQIAQRGSLTIPDWTLAAVPADLRDLFLTGLPQDGVAEPHEGVRFMGFFVADRDRGRVIGQFPHGFPAWIAVGYGLDGLTGARRAVGFWALLGLLAIYIVGQRAVGRPAAAAGALLLALNVAEVWYGRYPNSELMQQALLFAAIAALARASLDGDAFFAPVAGVLLGLLFFVRVDSFIALSGVGAGVAVAATQGGRVRWLTVLPFAGLFAVALWYLTGPLAAYSAIPIAQLRGMPGIGGGLAALAAAIWIGTRLHTSLPSLAAAVRKWLPAAIAVLIAAAAAYAYLFREPAGRLAAHDAYALRVYAWYVSPVGLLAAVVGFAVVSVRRFWKAPILLVATVVASVVLFYKIRIVPEHFWQARRYLTLALPMTCLLMAGGAFTGYEAWRGRLRSAGAGAPGPVAWLRHLFLPVLVLGFVAWQSWTLTKPVFHHVEYAGLIPAVEKIAGEFSDRDLIVIESRNSSDVHVIATPLAYIYAKNVLVLASPRPDRLQFERFLRWAGRTYDRVVFVADGGTDLGNDHLEARPLGLERFQVAEYESLRDALPRVVRQKKFSLGFYAIALAEAPVRVRSIDVGGFDDLWVLRIYAKEQSEGATYRWTRDSSYVSLQGLLPSDRTLVLRMYNGGRPAAAGPATVRVLLEDRELGAVTVEGPWRDYEIPLPPDVVAAAAARDLPFTVRLISSTWTPQAVLGGADDRALGVMLGAVRVE